MEEFHFIRPLWLWALLVVALLLVLITIRKRSQSNWFGVIDPQLMPFVLRGEQPQKKRMPVILSAIAGLLAVLALAGPSWERLPTPSFQNQAALVIALDLSLSMESQDIKPSRLIRAQHKISDILKQRLEGQTALIVYAAQAFTVSPLTQDTETIQLQMQNLSSDLMPAQGSRADLAIAQALELFEHAHIRKGEILLITDGIDQQESNAAINTLNASGHRLLILGVGTPSGAPIKKPSGGFVTDGNGAIVIPKLNERELAALAKQTQGSYHRITTDDNDINSLLKSNPSIDITESDAEIKTDTWKDEGYWLILIIIPLVLPVFRKGILSIVLLAAILPAPQPSYAFTWDDLWLNQNQRGKESFTHKQHEIAAEQFSEPNWKAAALYRAEKYEESINELTKINTANAQYNKGNAHAKLGQIAQAIESYEQALALEPDHEDAKHNLDLLKKLQEQQQQNQPSQDDQQEDKEQKQNEENKQSSSSEQPENSNQSDSKRQDQQEESSQSEQQQNKEAQQDDSNQQDAKQKEADEKNETQKEQGQQQAKKTDESKENPDSNEETQQAAHAEPLSEEQQATEQWIRRIPDDPGGLLRRKFKHKYDQNQHKSEKEQW